MSLNSLAAPIYRIAVRGPDLKVVAEVDQYLSLTLQSRFNEIGAWVLELPPESDAAQALQEGYGLLVVRNGQVVLSGPMSHREDKGDEQGDTVVVSGYDDTIHLADRLAYPCAAPYTAQADDVRSDRCESVLRGYVQDNCVTGGAWVDATTRPPVPGLTVAPDLARGSVVEGRARFVNLLELLTSLALAGGDLGFQVTQTLTDPPGLAFQVYVPADRTGTAVFSRAFGNLRTYDYATEAPTGNAILVGGSGEGTARLFAETDDAASIATYGRRIEQFVDRRDTGTPSELQQTGNEELANRAERAQLTLEPIDTDTLSYRHADPARGYQLGDKVTVNVNGAAISQVLREVTITLDANGETIAPVVGTPGAMLTHSQTYVLRHLHRRISLQERR